MRLLRALILILVTGSLILFLATIVPAYHSGARLLSVQSNSMEPAFKSGDAIVMVPTAASDLNFDDIVSYKSDSDPRIIISHRLVDIDSESGLIYAKGDNNNMVDEAIKPSQVVGRVERVMPRAGYAIDILHKPIGLIATVYMPGALILIYEFKRLVRRFARPMYQLYGHRGLR